MVMAVPVEDALSIEASPTDEMLDILIPRAKRTPLESAVRNEDIEYAAILLEDRVLLAAHRGSGALEIGARRPMNREIGKTPLWKTLIGGKIRYEVRLPMLAKDGGAMGAVSVGFSEDRIKRDILWFSLSFALAGALAMAMLIAGVLVFLRRHIAGPLKHLVLVVD